MNNWKKNSLLFFLMFAASILAIVLTPHHKTADDYPPVNLQLMIPVEFGDWRNDASAISALVSPDVQAKLDKIYNQTLARTYTDSKGHRIMLSIAYGGDQSDSTQLHRPEVCYVAQGFQISRNVVAPLETPGKQVLSVKRLMANMGNRSEPITYWIKVGDKTVVSGIEQKLEQLKFGLRGKIPDGFLVRVSSITTETEEGYELQKAFINEMLDALTNENRIRVSGV